MIQLKPFTQKFRCEHPIKVHTPLGDIYVPCRHCPSCRMIKSNNMRLSAQLEALNNKGLLLFGTLTYDNAHLPLCQLNYNEYTSEITFKPLNYESDRKCYFTPRVLKSFSFNFLNARDKESNAKARLEKTLSFISKRTEQPFGIIPVVSYRDVQLFFKRLRSAYFEEFGKRLSFRCYIVSEYGPKHFRPHFHFLLYIKDNVDALWVLNHYHESWDLGRTDLQYSAGGSTSYVTSYVTSLGVLPQLYRDPALRPVCRHSSFFGNSGISEVYEFHSKTPYDFHRIFDKTITLDGKNVHSSSTHLFENFLFYRPFSYAKCTFGELLFCLRKISEELPYFKRISEYSKYLYKQLNEKFIENLENNYTPWYFIFADTIICNGNSNRLVTFRIPSFDRFYHRILSYVKVIKICKEFKLFFHEYLNYLDSYLHSKEQYRLKEFYFSINEFISDNKFGSYTFPLTMFFYDNFEYDKLSPETTYDNLDSSNVLFSWYLCDIPLPSSVDINGPFHIGLFYEKYQRSIVKPYLSSKRNSLRKLVKHKSKNKEIDYGFKCNEPC